MSPARLGGDERCWYFKDEEPKEYEFKAAPNIRGFSDYYTQHAAYNPEVLEECPDCFLHCDLSTHECCVMGTALARLENTPVFSMYWYYYSHQSLRCPAYVVARRHRVFLDTPIVIRGLKFSFDGWKGICAS